MHIFYHDPIGTTAFLNTRMPEVSFNLCNKTSIESHLDTSTALVHYHKLYYKFDLQLLALANAPQSLKYIYILGVP